tara:strand:+ start:2538 stop:3245 length:708 start_codon:yes stop_codon:yes gene_type:complete
MKLSVIIPVYNEENTVEILINKVINNNYDNKEIIIIDDFSKDNSYEKILNFKKYSNIKIIQHQYNKGKGSCLRTAQEFITGEICLIQDGDLEYDPKEHVRLIKPIIEGNADVVYGSRFTGYGESRSLLFWHRFGNFILTYLCNIFTNLNLTDMETCYKVIKSNFFKNIEICEDRFGVEPEITIKLAKMKCRFYEIGINYYGRDYSEGKKITWKDGFRAVYSIFKYSFSKIKKIKS